MSEQPQGFQSPGEFFRAVYEASRSHEQPQGGFLLPPEFNTNIYESTEPQVPLRWWQRLGRYIKSWFPFRSSTRRTGQLDTIIELLEEMNSRLAAVEEALEDP